MKSSLRQICFVLTLIPSLAWALGSNIGRDVDRLDELVHLTAGQRSKATEIFTSAVNALQAFASVDERMGKGAPIREQARAQIRALLTPAQQEIYDRAPQRLGGGAMRDPAAKASRLDEVVTLTDEQIEPVAAIAQREADALLAIPVADRAVQGAKIRQETKAQLRALLTPEQQRKFDANPNLATDLVERAQGVAFIKNSPGIAARLGKIARVTPAGATTSVVSVDEQVQSMKGCYSYNVQGSTGHELLKIHWERESPSDPINVIRIESGAGTVIPR